MTEKSLKTFNLRRSTIKIVKTKVNQSEYVDRAIMKLHNHEQAIIKYRDEFDLRDIPTNQLLHVLTHRDLPKSLIARIREILFDN